MKIDKRIFGWMMYDFANSSFTTIIVTVVYSVYFKDIVVGKLADGTMLWSLAISLSMLLVALTAPVFGAVADYSRSKKKFLFINTYLTIIFTSLLYFVQYGDIVRGMFLFIVANFAFNSANVFYNAFLPEITNRENLGKVSGWGWAIGYAGGLLSLLISLPLVHNAVRWIFPSVALFFAVFSIFTFFWVKEIKKESQRTNYFKTAYKRIKYSYLNIRKINELKKFILSYFVYNDAIVTIISFGAIFGASEFGMSAKDLLVYFIIMQFSSMIGSLYFGNLADKIGTKKTISITLYIWLAVVIWAFICRNETEFYGVGILAGIAMGSSQSCSRTMLALLTPESKKTEFFGFYAFSGKLAAIIGPVVYGLIRYITSSHRVAILSIAVFLVAGLILISRVNEERGIKESTDWID
ncbi:MAG: MFS transporter [Candidatus Cloacimonetes bacterium]|nr:MFS transporter [Candidatus Cloacimonadota bacterium]